RGAAFMTNRPIGPAGDDDDADAYSIAAFCRRHDISESFFHKLRGLGRGPATMRVGARVLISREAARAWRKRHTETERFIQVSALSNQIPQLAEFNLPVSALYLLAAPLDARDGQDRHHRARAERRGDPAPRS